MGFLTPFYGFCMKLADSVPGVSGSTVAFILGFYDHFINATHDLSGRDKTNIIIFRLTSFGIDPIALTLS